MLTYRLCLRLGLPGPVKYIRGFSCIVRLLSVGKPDSKAAGYVMSREESAPSDRAYDPVDRSGRYLLERTHCAICDRTELAVNRTGRIFKVPQLLLQRFNVLPFRADT
jgi:hypothetical protein